MEQTLQANIERIEDALRNARDIDFETERDYYREGLALEARLGRFHNGRS